MKANELQIDSYIHCGKCLDELPDGETPQDYKNYDIGFTDTGLQVWCVRHNCNVMHVDFEGQTHPADTTAINFRKLKSV